MREMNILIMPFIGALGSIFMITCFVFFTRKIHKKVEYRISNYYQVLLLGILRIFVKTLI